MNISLNTAWLFLKLKDGDEDDDSPPVIPDPWFAERNQQGPDPSDQGFTLAGSPVAGLPYKAFENLNLDPGTRSIEIQVAGWLAAVEDVLMVFQYSVSPSG